MAKALALAARGRGSTSPNPPVAAVVVRQHRIVGVGYHQRAGGPHAEVIALRQAGVHAAGGTLYVTLEPCCHLDKRTPPCAPLLIRAGLKRVVAATLDPNPKVCGRSMASLRKAGVITDVGIGRREAEQLIEPYRMRVTRGRPFVTLKVAATLDGKIATAGGESRWITSSAARARVQEVRAQSDAILVGVGTVAVDDPRLTVRRNRLGKAPLRIVLDPTLRIPIQSKVLSDGKAPTLVIATRNASASRRARLERGGAEVLVLPGRRRRIAWPVLLKELGRRGINSLLIEGGAEINASVLHDGSVDRVMFFLAPRLMGGHDAIGALGGQSPKRLAEMPALKDVTVRRIGPDILVEGRLR